MNFTVIAVATWAVVSLIGANASNSETTATNIVKRSPGGLGFDILSKILGLFSGSDHGSRLTKSSGVEQKSASKTKSGQDYQTNGLPEHGFGSEHFAGGLNHVPVPVPTVGPLVPVSREVHVVNRHVQPVSAPYPVLVHHDVAVPVPHPVPYAVDSPYPVLVPAPFPVPVDHPVPYAVDRPVPHAVPAPYPVPIIRDVPRSYHGYSGYGSGHEKSAYSIENHSSKFLPHSSSSYGHENSHYYDK